MKKAILPLFILACIMVVTIGAGPKIESVGQWILSGGTLSPADSSANVSMGTSKSAMAIITDGDGYVMSDGDMGSLVFMTGAGEVALPDSCDTATGKYVRVMVRDATEQVEVVVTDTVADLIVLGDGTALDINDEADLATAKSSAATFICLEANKWYIIGERGTVTDGGEPD